MKTKSLLTFAAVASFAAFVASLALSHDVFAGFATLAAGMIALIAVQEYAPRSYFVVTSIAPRQARVARQESLSYV